MLAILGFQLAQIWGGRKVEVWRVVQGGKQAKLKERKWGDEHCTLQEKACLGFGKKSS